MNIQKFSAAILCLAALIACESPPAPEVVEVEEEKLILLLQAEAFENSSALEIVKGEGTVRLDSGQWLEFSLNVPISGRYALRVYGESEGGGQLWVEDYVYNNDGRTYNITGQMNFPDQGVRSSQGVDGSPLADTLHPIRLHASKGSVWVDQIELELLKVHQPTPEILTQTMQGNNWELVWSDEFDGSAVDQSKWTYDLGDWGWGNHELQYYTEGREENARLEEGRLVIEARKNDNGHEWTSARLTTRGKVAFRYGRIELRAKVPGGKGCWAAGWTLGDAYVDELSWPYCGEIDILESVGFETDPVTDSGQAHATVHTPAYYFKIGNQITGITDVPNITTAWHTYAVDWYPDSIVGTVDGRRYYLYDKTADEREWPFHQPQNLILNLAMGGGWGGAMGMDTTLVSQRFELDYIRVYQKTH